MSVSTKVKSAGIKVSKTKKTSWTVDEMQAARKKEQDRRIEEKIKLLERYSTSEDLFDALRDEINTLCQDESSDDFSIGDDYNFGVEYDIELLLELTSDLRWFTRFYKEDDNKSITTYNLNYLRDYF